MLHVHKTHRIVEPTTCKPAFGNEGALEATNCRTPLDDLLEKEEAPDGDEVAINGAKIEAIRRLLIYCFGETRDMLQALQKLSLICYIICPHLIEDCSLDTLAKSFDTTRQCFSKKLLKINKEFNLRARNQKGSIAVETYRARTKLWHEEVKADTKAQLEKQKKAEAKRLAKEKEEARIKEMIDKAKQKAKERELAKDAREAEARRKKAEKDRAHKAAVNQRKLDRLNALPTRKIQTPEGKVLTFKNLTEFARKHDLDPRHLRKVYSGKYQQHKGYRLPQQQKDQSK